MFGLSTFAFPHHYFLFPHHYFLTTLFCFCEITHMGFQELIIAYPKDGQWPPSTKFAPLAQTSGCVTVAKECWDAVAMMKEVFEPGLWGGRRKLFRWWSRKFGFQFKRVIQIIQMFFRFFLPNCSGAGVGDKKIKCPEPEPEI